MKKDMIRGCLIISALFLGACGLGSEGTFTSGLTEDRCEDTFPICQTTAQCALGTGRYLEGSFPGSRQFIVSAPEEAIIRVMIFFRTQIATGQDTEILWREPGCFDTYQYRSEGRDIFREAGNSRVFTQSQQVFLEGDHLVQVFSDAVADYLLKVEVEAPSGNN